MAQEKIIKGTPGWVIILGMVGYAILLIILCVTVSPIMAVLFLLLIPFCFGSRAIGPNDSIVLTLCGTYKGTIKANGCFWINPLMQKDKISIKAQNFSTPNIKVNDKAGNPIIIGAIVVAAVQDTYMASFNVDNRYEFLRTQCEGALREVAGQYPYDNANETDDDAITLVSGKDEINHELAQKMNERLQVAGMRVYEARISDLSYSNEIAAAMLQRQQAAAIITARRKIVEGAVGMVELVFEEMRRRNLPEMSQAKKEELIANLMVILCSDKSVNPTLSV